ncbi:hypothetical protein [Fusibacillus kribbianus]|uniref:Uncharacterized protein n=1 Tax=Fusibacillus kribbianus TaxID=3044208 RepID=A0AAP4B9Q9_9FIRM|nr:hypothetical protein [Ruminococcus sp. YH-rum2234]MDI9242626.1 hypothetical protein [Ruminococcus sp. YH-rum2234]
MNESGLRPPSCHTDFKSLTNIPTAAPTINTAVIKSRSGFAITVDTKVVI